MAGSVSGARYHGREPGGLAALSLSALTTTQAQEVEPDPIAATLSQAPAGHDGATAFDLHLDFSREPAGLSYRSIDGGVVGVQSGDITRVWRRERGSSRRWGVQVTPASAGDVTVTVHATTDCAAQHAVCAADGGMLAGGTQATVPGPPALSVADATATEAEGATLDFTVTLSRAPGETVTVAYATADGTATAGADYTSTSGTLTFQANETAKTVSVPVLVDTQDDGGETLTLALSNPNPSRVTLADPTATGTIANSVVTPTPAALPSAPTGVTATAGDSGAVLAWTAGPDNGSAVTKWQQRRSTDGGATWDPGWTDIAGSGATTIAHRVTGLANGTEYSFQLRAVNGEGAGAASGLVTATPRSAPVDPPPARPRPPGTVSGALAGTLAVNRYGAATYQIPIEVPPGTAGVEPSLSLAYASNGGNGLLGVGWSLGGLSAIGRCPRTPAQDGARGAIGYDADDRFCLDGRRLVAVSGAYGADGTAYRTEIDGFAKIVSRGRAGTGPARFEVRTKSGQTMEYGNTANSRIEAVGRSEARLWALNRVTDAVGNYLTLRYREEDGQGYPDRIDYTGHDTGGAPYASVRFAYQTRHDVRVLASGGSTQRMDERLAKVRTYHGETLVSEYRLTYSPNGLQPSRVKRVERCDGGGACLPATNFSWNDFGNGTLAPAEGGTVVSGNYSGYELLRGDFNGDGVTDLAWAHARDGGLRARVALAEGDGSFAAPRPSDPKTSGNFSGFEPLVGDFNGDGLSDIIWTKADASGLRAWVALGRGDGTLAAATDSNPSTENSYGFKRLVGDFNGDGIADLAWATDSNKFLAAVYAMYPYLPSLSPPALEARAYVALGEGDGTLAAAQRSDPDDSARSDEYAAGIGDFNGDGLSDLVWTWADSSGLRALAALGNGDGTLSAAVSSRPRTGSSSDYKPLIGDFNGDRIADLVWTKSNSSGSSAYAALGKGDGRFGAATYSALRTSSCKYDCSRNPTTGDFNGDGVSDIAWTGTRYRKERQCGGLFNLDCWHKRRHRWARAEISLGEGDGSFARARVYEHWGHGNWSGYGSLVGDFNGDGVSDVAWTKAKSYGLYAYTALNQAPSSYGRVLRISSATGPTFSLSYAPLTDGSVYVKDTGHLACALPCQDVQMPLHVVRAATKYYGRLSHRTTYRYGGAKVDIAGRGFLGFRWMEATDTATGVRSSTEYRQVFPYIGQVSASSSFLANRTALSAEENSWARKSLNGGKTTFPYVSRSVAESYELGDGPGNAPVATVTTSSTYDGYGNPTAMTVTTAGAGGSFVKTTANTYANDTANWHLGRLTCARMTSQAPGQGSRTRVSGFAYDAATGLLTKEVIEPGSGDVAGCVSAAAGTGITLITAHGHDKYGNRNRATVSGPGIAARATAMAWGERAADGTVTANGRFAVGATNALGHAEKRWHDPAYGKVVRLRGPNGLETAWQYDGFGRPLRETRADGTETVTAFLSCRAAGVACPSGAVRAVRVRASGAAAATRYLNPRGMELRVQTAGFDGRAIYRDTVYDSLGRATSRSRPYFAGGTARWTRLSYDAGGRPTGETRPDGSRTEMAHDGLVDGAVRQRVKVFPAGSGSGGYRRPHHHPRQRRARPPGQGHRPAGQQHHLCARRARQSDRHDRRFGQRGHARLRHPRPQDGDERPRHGALDLHPQRARRAGLAARRQGPDGEHDLRQAGADDPACRGRGHHHLEP